MTWFWYYIGESFQMKQKVTVKEWNGYVKFTMEGELILESVTAVSFVEENLKTIFAYALSRVSDKDDAEDLTNDIVLAILQNGDKLNQPEAFFGYVWGIAANTYRKFLRKRSNYRQRMSVTTEEDALSGLEAQAAEGDFAEELVEGMALREEMRTLRREIALLTKEYRECTVAYYFEELSCAETAERLGISLEMVKYYLFKTRKILKEGISMEREFGEKSFKPEPFEFVTIFSGDFNREYHNLFARKLPGQILLSAYYTPMSVRELAIELGVASVYLEDELALLEKYNLLKKTATGKYQTSLVIFTEDFTKEFHREAKKLAVPALGEILVSMKNRMEEIRTVNGSCGRLSEERLLWGLLWPVMRMGVEAFSKNYPQYEEKSEIYRGASGTNYGAVDNELEGEFGCYAFAGYSGIDENYYAMAADFGVLPEKNQYFTGLDREMFREKIYKTVTGELEPEFLVVTEKEEIVLGEVLKKETGLMAELYGKLFDCASRVMRLHAPKQMESEVEKIIFQTLLFRTTGLLGGCAVQSKELQVPEFDGPAAVCVKVNTKTAQATVTENVAVMEKNRK